MELYAAMVENLDHHVGRLMAHLEARGVYENTLIVFMSDNGAAAEDFYYAGPFVEYLQANYDNSYENMGRPDSWVSYGAQWAEAGAAPFSRYKGYARQGGIVSPMIIAGPGVNHRGEITRTYVTVMDLAPTLLDVAGASYPDDRAVRPMEGESLVALLTGEASTVHDTAYVTTLFHAGRAFVRRGPWKLSNLEPPFHETAFELFDVVADPGETTNLASRGASRGVRRPSRGREMLELGRHTGPGATAAGVLAAVNERCRERLGIIGFTGNPTDAA
jgi:arylsulfatase A-like enzyme